MSIRAWIFDLDGVITDTAVYHFQAWKAMADKLGIAFDEEDNEALKGVSRRESLERILAKSSQHFSDDEKQRLMDEKNEDYKKLISTITHDDVFDGVETCFASLKQKDIRIGLASASKNAGAIIEGLGIAPMFDYVADAGRIANSKPAPDIFLDVMQAFGLSANECIGIEDAQAGVEAIKSAQMFAVGIGDKAVLNRANIVFATMRELDVEMVLSQAA